MTAFRRLLLLQSGESTLSRRTDGLVDGSDQRIWHALHDELHELPFAYNANADANVSAAEWAKVRVLHDIVTQRKRGWLRSGYHELVSELTRDAKRALMQAQAQHLQQTAGMAAFARGAGIL